MSAKNYTGVRQVERGDKLRWIIDFRYVDKEGAKRRFKRDALVQARDAAHAEAKRLMKNAAETGDPGGKTEPTKSTVATFKEFVEGQWSRDYLSLCKPSTQDSYKRLLKSGLMDHLGDVPLDEIDKAHVREYVAKLKERSVHPKGSVDVVRSILRSAYEAKIIIHVPTLTGLYKRGEKIPKVYGEGEIEKIVQKASGWLQVAIALGAYAGLRVGEVLGLEVGDIDLQRKVLFVRRSMFGKEVGTTKSGKDRVVPLHPELLRLLPGAMHSKLPKARVIIRKTGTYPSRQNVYTALRKIQHRLGLPPHSFHELRHTFCTSLVRAGANIDQVRVLAGHSDIGTTQKYIHTSGSELEGAMGKLSVLK